MLSTLPIVNNRTTYGHLYDALSIITTHITRNDNTSCEISLIFKTCKLFNEKKKINQECIHIYFTPLFFDDYMRSSFVKAFINGNIVNAFPNQTHVIKSSILPLDKYNLRESIKLNSNLQYIDRKKIYNKICKIYNNCTPTQWENLLISFCDPSHIPQNNSWKKEERHMINAKISVFNQGKLPCCKLDTLVKAKPIGSMYINYIKCDTCEQNKLCKRIGFHNTCEDCCVCNECGNLNTLHACRCGQCSVGYKLSSCERGTQCRHKIYCHNCRKTYYYYLQYHSINNPDY